MHYGICAFSLDIFFAHSPPPPKKVLPLRDLILWKYFTQRPQINQNLRKVSMILDKRCNFHLIDPCFCSFNLSTTHVRLHRKTPIERSWIPMYVTLKNECPPARGVALPYVGGYQVPVNRPSFLLQSYTQ